MKQNISLAKKRVKRKKGFYVHLGVFLSVGLFFLIMNLLTSRDELWFFFPMLPWAVGLAIHYLVIFGLPGTDILSQEWEEREMKKELYRIRRERAMDKRPGAENANQPDEALDLEGPVRRKVPRLEDLDEEEFV